MMMNHLDISEQAMKVLFQGADLFYHILLRYSEEQPSPSYYMKVNTTMSYESYDQSKLRIHLFKEEKVSRAFSTYWFHVLLLGLGKP